MILQVFAIRDEAVGAFLPPFYGRSKGEAVRSFTEAANDVKSNFARHPQDFVLYFLGEYDDGQGTFKCGIPTMIFSAKEVLIQDEAEKLASMPTPRSLPM